MPDRVNFVKMDCHYSWHMYTSFFAWTGQDNNAGILFYLTWNKTVFNGKTGGEKGGKQTNFKENLKTVYSSLNTKDFTSKKKKV